MNVLNQINRNTPSPMSQNGNLLIIFAITTWLTLDSINPKLMFNIRLGSASNNSVTISKHPEPLFVTVPPRPTRVFHSEAYIK